MNELPNLAASAKAALHAGYLRKFLADGFDVLGKLERLGDKAENKAKTHGEDAEPRLAGLGPERSAALLGACQAEPSLLSAVYWIVCANAVLQVPLDPILADKTGAFLQSCLSARGGFCPHPEHHPNVLSTQSGIQLLVLLDRKDILDDSGPRSVDGIASYVCSLRLPDGSFCARTAARPEGDCRFVYAALHTLVLLGVMRIGEGDVGDMELGQTVDWLLSCQNFDGGFGCRPGGECESHAGHTFCCLASLALTGSLDRLDDRAHARLVRWLCDRQCENGGLNGRPGKAPDSCYTWWTLASTEILRKHHAKSAGLALEDFFRLRELQTFVLSCMSSSGGVSNHPGDKPDPFHTFFGLAGLSLLCQALPSISWGEDIFPMCEMSPVVAMPQKLASRWWPAR
mmetsp:Transcript_41178/g.106537  ORF Transcript_41178/g.106537 Transcript_41178/m.106537 type:complete len:400 (-) Transcript_41178:103-1302(-)